MKSQPIITTAIYALVVITILPVDNQTAFGAVAELVRYALLLSLSALIILYAFVTRRLTISLSAEWLLMIAFLSYMALSALWSDGFLISMIKGMLILSAMMLSISLANIKQMDGVLIVFYRCMCGFVVLSILAVIFFPDIGIETGWEIAGDWRGIAGQKNGLGYVSALVFVAALSIPILGKTVRGYPPGAVMIRLAMVLISAVCLVNSGSRGALLTAGVGLGSVMLARAPKLSQRVVLVMFFAFAIPLVNLTLPTLELSADQIGVLGTTIDTSNRTTLWFYGLDQLADREFFGFGVGGFWTPERMTTFRDTYGWVLDNFHNGYITILIEGGLVGLALLLTAIASIMLLFLVAVGNLKDAYLSVALGYTNMFLFGNLVENEIGRSTATTFIMFLATSFALRSYVTRLVARDAPEPARLVYGPAAFARQ